MNSKQSLGFISYLIGKYQTYATQEKDGLVVIDELREAKKAVLDGRLSFYSWKRFFVPECEILFGYENEKLSDGGRGGEKIVLIGLNLLDLKYVLLYDRVFANDPYYQNYRNNLLIVAHNFLPGPENNFTHTTYKEENLKHYKFDIFLAAQEDNLGNVKKGASFKVFAGSKKGEEVLDNFGYKDYRRVECAGSLNEDYSGSKMNVFREKLKDHHNPQIWEELGKRCIECGKCTIACPTCFCFRIDDSPSLEAGRGQRQRCWDTCFYQEFSEIAGPPDSKPKFLKSTAERIHFWYYHKFGRIPDEYSIAGCVGCHRCYQVCPVEIDIKQTLKDIEQS